MGRCWRGRSGWEGPCSSSGKSLINQDGNGSGNSPAPSGQSAAVQVGSIIELTGLSVAHQFNGQMAEVPVPGENRIVLGASNWQFILVRNSCDFPD